MIVNPEIVVCQNSMRRPFEIVELTALHAPNEGGADDEREHDRERDEQEKDVHAYAFVSRNALPTTTSDDTDMPIAATSGET